MPCEIFNIISEFSRENYCGQLCLTHFSKLQVILIAAHQHVHYVNVWFQTYSDQSFGKQATPTRPKLSNASGSDWPECNHVI